MRGQREIVYNVTRAGTELSTTDKTLMGQNAGDFAIKHKDISRITSEWRG